MNVIENAEAVNKINRAHWDRIEIINKMQAYQELEMLDLSQREIVKKIGVPRSTVTASYEHQDTPTQIVYIKHSEFPHSCFLKIA